jgi:hypothetical protein
MEGKRIEDIKGITEVIKLQAENSDLWVVLIITWDREYVFIYGTEEEVQEAYGVACGAMANGR